MKTEIKQQWVDALRSGEYVQGTGCLRYEDRFCCLGVLCDLGVKAGIVISKNSYSYYEDYDEEDPEETPEYFYGKEQNESTLPEEVISWAEIDPNVEIYGDTIQDNLINMNDAHNFSFNDIADYIEENL